MRIQHKLPARRGKCTFCGLLPDFYRDCARPGQAEGRTTSSRTVTSDGTRAGAVVLADAGSAGADGEPVGEGEPVGDGESVGDGDGDGDADGEGDGAAGGDDLAGRDEVMRTVGAVAATPGASGAASGGSEWPPRVE